MHHLHLNLVQDNVCFLSKNLYNYANYIIRQEFIQTSKDKEAGHRTHANWIHYNEIDKILLLPNFSKHEFLVKYFWLSEKFFIFLQQNCNYGI